MKKKLFLLAIVMSVIFSMALMASAALLDVPVPSNAYITIGNYDVAWISPVDEGYYLDLSYQSQFGWKVMTADVFNQLGLSAFSFVKVGANVDYFTGNNYDEVSGATLAAVYGTPPGGDVAIAVPYFSTQYYHADWGDGEAGLWNFTGSEFYLETLAYRQVPVPAAVWLFGTGLAGLVGLRRRFLK
jgi:hypothetical protein